MRRREFIPALGGAAAMVLTFLGPVRAQDLMRHLDLTSPDMTSAEMTPLMSRSRSRRLLSAHPAMIPRDCRSDMDKFR